LADAIKRSGKLKITACYSRLEQKRAAFAAKRYVGVLSKAPNAAPGPLRNRRPHYRVRRQDAMEQVTFCSIAAFSTSAS
jgi:hypothetical protein